MNTDLIIIGAGAAGLMAGALAGEAGLAAIVVERRHRPGLKLLMCGNNRCNISHGGTAEELIGAYGEPVGSFLRSALELFPPARLRAWFAAAGMPTSLNRERIYPRTERADDVLYCFTDRMREQGIPMIFNCPVQRISIEPGGVFSVHCDRLTLRSRQLLLATGGVSYPKTGSVGDGQRLAGELGHRILPFRAGLVGMEVADRWLQPAARGADVGLPYVRLRLSCDGQDIASCEGNILCSPSCLRGSAVFDATRIIARQNLRNAVISLDLFPSQSPSGLRAKISALLPRCAGQLAGLLKQLGIGAALCDGLAASLGGNSVLHRQDPVGELADRLKTMPLSIKALRPLKEAIVTVGGVSMEDIEPTTMESKRVPGLFFAGEVMDIDGPTGGYNLHAAFATAQLAMETIKKRCPKISVTPQILADDDANEEDLVFPDAPRRSTGRARQTRARSAQKPRERKGAHHARPASLDRSPRDKRTARNAAELGERQESAAKGQQRSPEATPPQGRAGRSRGNAASKSKQRSEGPERPERPERSGRPRVRDSKSKQPSQRTSPAAPEAPWWAKNKKRPDRR
jgi:predicted Rossmann fold flavoprotein